MMMVNDRYDLRFIDVVDDSKIDDAVKMLEDYYPEGTIVKLALADEDMETVNS